MDTQEKKLNEEILAEIVLDAICQYFEPSDLWPRDWLEDWIRQNFAPYDICSPEDMSVIWKHN